MLERDTTSEAVQALSGSWRGCYFCPGLVAELGTGVRLAPATRDSRVFSESVAILLRTLRGEVYGEAPPAKWPRVF
ncbi:hypothetical protein EVAR_64887_1 [Eumeta japonica]|uniref:Uncharacterized protein n=1 Tax=Eumeta variegata TaxID=151549 RepID=A0A4C1ZSE9_EUMVA|nr:hypothetical protein EVAR_64887_1 [Eumeta japonica]